MSKRFRTSSEEDRITNLPESVICHILSRLPLHIAVRTCVLSKDWECKWTTIYNLDIDESRLPFWIKYRDGESFVSVVNRMFSLLRGLRSFRLRCEEKYEPSTILAWISDALSRNVEIFELEAYCQKPILLPPSLVNNLSLRKLKILTSPSTFSLPLNNYIPNLTDLYLFSVEILNDISSISDQVVFTFPALKTLELIDCKWMNMKHVKICSPVLTTFRNQNHTSEISDYLITICGAKVEKLMLSGSFPENIHMTESTVRYAAFSPSTYNLESDPRSDLLARKLLRQVSSTVTYLKISTNVYKTIAQTRRELPLPRFDTLQRLVISITGSVKPLLEFIHLAPRIKFLELSSDRQTPSEVDYDEREFFYLPPHIKFLEFNGDEQIPAELDCDELDSVPDGLISHLEEVKFNLMSVVLLFHLAKFLLKNAVKLKKVHIGSDYKRPDRIARRLPTFTKVSLNVEFVYKEKDPFEELFCSLFDSPTRIGLY